MTTPLYIAVDLGAGSGRVFLASVDPSSVLFEEIRRFYYTPRQWGGYLRWDFVTIFENILLGLKAASERAKELGRAIDSIGVDSWAVDYGLIDQSGKLIADPICYRDPRTLDTMNKAFTVVPRSEIFEKTGIQFLNFNTLFQLYSETAPMSEARQLLLLPDLINFFLTGTIAAEYTNATTTQMINAATRDWDTELLKRLCLPVHLLPKIIQAGTVLGILRADIASETGLAGVKVVAPATHDTASAVAAAPLADDTAFISSGTWSLIGIERTSTLINQDVAAHNFTNEGGVYGSIRFLKNVMGLWIFEACRREWQTNGIDLTYDEILEAVGRVDNSGAFIFPDDGRFLNPPSMLDAIRQQLAETGQRIDEDPTAVSKLIFDSLAFRYMSVLQTIEKLTSVKLSGVQVVGGGGRNRYLNQMTANASGLTVLAGLAEATVVGNVLVQAISSGRFASLAQARTYVSENFSFDEFVSQPSPYIEEARLRYAAIEARYIR